MSTPLPSEAPYFLRVLLNVPLNIHDRLPSGVRLALGRYLAWQNPLCASYGLKYGHGVSQRGTEPQPPETERRRSLRATNLPAPPQTEGAAAVGSSEKLAADFIMLEDCLCGLVTSPALSLCQAFS